MLRKYLFLLLFSVTAIQLGFAKSSKKKLSFFAADNPNIQYVGRIDFSHPKRPRFWQPGIYFTTRFTGTRCEVILNDEVLWGKNHNYLEVVVDGQPVRLQTKAATDTIVVADGLKEGTHTLLVCKNTEANIGWLELVGIRCKQLLKPALLPLRKIECIGNSITCGASADESQIPCGKGVWQDQHNAYLAYGPTAARALNAQYHLSSVSGIGLMHSCCNLPILMPQVYDKVSMRDDSIRWSFKNYTPDIVTICLGQNDGIQDSATFCSNYVAFIKQVRSYYPAAKIVLLTSPMADANLKAFMQKTLASVVQTVHKSGDSKLWMYAFEKRYYKGCDTHPNVEEHQEIAKELTAFIQKTFKW